MALYGGYIIILSLLLQNDDADFSELLITLQGGACIKITERKQGAYLGTNYAPAHIAHVHNVIAIVY